MRLLSFLEVARELEQAGLIWQPEIGDEVAERVHDRNISILVDPQGMTPGELRSIFLWLPTVEQLIYQVEARQAILFHAGLELGSTQYCYKTVLKAPVGPIECCAESLRESVGKALRQLLLSGTPLLLN